MDDHQAGGERPFDETDVQADTQRGLAAIERFLGLAAAFDEAFGPEAPAGDDDPGGQPWR